jgi:F-type H+-transporting ATPase subunit delta
VKGAEASHNYAKAIYMAAFESWLTALKTARDRLAAQSQMVCDFSNPDVTADMAREEVRSLLPEGSPVEMENALLVLAREDALPILEDITADFEALVTAGTKTLLAHVTSAVQLTDEEKTAVRDKVYAEFGTDLEFEFAVNPAIIGGLIVRVGGRILDNSVAGKLGALRENLGLGPQR